jgi:hypothetical protein
MNVDHIYQLQRDDAFASQFSATEYQTFVAMPFSNRGGYPEARIKALLLEKVHARANALRPAPPGERPFAPLRRVDGGSGGAIVITDEIAADILGSHFFLGDLTGCNMGVVLETGIALALKPNGRVLLFTQDDSASLHFDLNVTNVNRYTEDDLVEKAASAIVGAADVFEKEANRYITFLSSQLTSDAIMVLNQYGQRSRGLRHGSPQPGIFYSAVKQIENFEGPAGRVAFHDGVRELSARRLMWTYYGPNVATGMDQFAFHATKLGWLVIESLWHHDSKMRKPKSAPTGPNLS